MPQMEGKTGAKRLGIALLRRITDNPANDVVKSQEDDSFLWLDGQIDEALIRKILKRRDPLKSEPRVLFLGTNGEDRLFSKAEVFFKYAEGRGIVNVEVIPIKMAPNIAVHFFGLSSTEEKEPTLPVGVVLGTHMRSELGLNKFTHSIDNVPPGFTVSPAEIARRLCHIYSIPITGFPDGKTEPTAGKSLIGSPNDE